MDDNSYFGLASFSRASATIQEQAKEIERLRKEVAELRNATGHSWKAVADGMPPIGKDYLVYMPGAYCNRDKIETQSCCNDGNWRPTWPDGWNKGQIFEITHWMPLPKPPAVEGEP